VSARRWPAGRGDLAPLPGPLEALVAWCALCGMGVAAVAYAVLVNASGHPPDGHAREAGLVERTSMPRAVALPPCGAATSSDLEPTAMTLIPGGEHRPFYRPSDGAEAVPVGAVLLEVAPVSRRQFAAFVRQAPAWRRSNVERLYAEDGYLRDWPGDVDPGEAGQDAPVTFVSWFAAKAYCDCAGRRLPTVMEWERAAGEATGQGVAAGPGGLASTGSRAAFAAAMGGAATRSAPGRLAFGRVWEWTSDFNSALVAGPSLDGGERVSSQFCGDGVRASDAADYAAFLRYAFRSSLRADYTLKNLGFRCVRDPR
jgi:formylglycine-generating enzyme